ncbi:MAG: tetratricopeptide repeat protein, partial [Armatimonadetes bacterium]|nr:tetratricopeptide repeat protein [Armatimonadota bacterium]
MKSELIKELERALAQDPNNANLHYQLALAYEGIGDLQTAVKEYEKALSINPYLSLAYFNLGLIYTKSQAFELAVQKWQKIVDFDGDLDIKAINYHQRTYIIKEAVGIWDKYLGKLTPKDTIGMFYGAFVFLILGKLEKAEEIFLNLVDLNPNFDLAHYYLGISLNLLDKT